MKTLRLGFAVLVASACLASPLSFAAENELRLHFVAAEGKVDWSSPRGLLISAARNAIKSRYASMGHVAVELSCRNANAYGVRHVLTAMADIGGKDMRKTVFVEGLGLGTLLHGFPGELEASASLGKDLVDARRNGRMRTLVIPTSDERCGQMLDFLDRWIENGSYTVYGGGQDVYAGQGAGCADFARVFFEIATGTTMPEEWLIRLRLPKELVGTPKRPVSLLSVLLRGGAWASPDASNVVYITPDPTLIHDWIRVDEATWPGSYDPATPKELPPFAFRYATKASAAAMWKAVSIR